MSAAEVGSLRIRLEAADAQFDRDLRTARKKLKRFGQTARDVAGAGVALGGLSAGLIGVARSAARASTALNTGMADVATLIPGNTARIGELKAEVRGLSIAHGKNAQELARPRVVLDLIEEQLDEEILYLPADAVADAFAGETCIDKAAARALLDRFTADGRFESREVVESDDTLIQALPVAVVRNRAGDVLRLRRRERRRDNPLHEKLVIWAGGHVRREDGENGVSVLQCAVRELQEELRFSVDAKDLNLLGAVWTRTGDRARRHAAIVFEWRAAADDAAVALSAVEFFERRGTSLSGTFVGVDALAADIDAKQVCEPWSVEIVRRLLPDVGGRRTTPLLV